MAFSTTRTPGGEGLSSEINVTPLIDVLLVMLIIFMVIVPVMPRGLHSALPSDSSAGATAELPDRPVLVEIERRQTSVAYLVDGVSLGRDEVAPRLVEQVLLKADAELNFGVIAGMIDAGKAAGAESVGLLTPRTDPPQN
jgi:biopolymer transport protein TolR